MNKNTIRVLEKIGWFLLGWLVFIGLFSSFKQIPPRPDSYNSQFVFHPIQTMLHAVPGVLFMIVGPLQFISSLRAKRPKLHRWLGRLFMVSCIIIALSGFSIALTIPYTRLPGTIAVFFFGVPFLYSLYRAYIHIKRREVSKHREWILRVFSIGMGISLIRIFVSLLVVFTDYTQRDIFDLAFWAGFGLCWLVGELWIRATRT